MTTEEQEITDFSHGHLQVLSYKGEHATLSGIGIIHGLASNDELLLFLTLTLGISSYLYIFIGLTIFTVGVVIGMILYSSLLKIPFAKYGQERVLRVVNLSIATLTLVYAYFILTGNETVNLLPVISDDLSGALYLVAFILGIKHSLDADHVVAISSILLRAPTLKKTFSLSISWALGHMLTASIITFILFTFREVVLDKFLGSFEIIVAVMLIIIALLTIAWEFNIISFGKHSHGHLHDDHTVCQDENCLKHSHK
ncbi:MAG: hypothetical protein GPJ54_17980 [Candidatus Heimdallarchaeota archaeon]|nr:hypothetical protein [Candidatus Heimdallarchaeota archaeon]